MKKSNTTLWDPCSESLYFKLIPSENDLCDAIRQLVDSLTEVYDSHGNNFLLLSSMRAGLVIYLAVVHAVAIFLFTRGFLLRRLALSDVAELSEDVHERPQPTHKRAVVLIIDALRFDFISPNPPIPPNAYHHNVLTLPAELTKAHPERSFMFNAYADPPTSTLQRIKALTTGSLPTFVDLGNAFRGSEVSEDSIVQQLQLANKTIAFMGDDTWMSVYPNSFHPNLTFPYFSFNVEDLHTVDAGVLAHLFPLLLNSHPGLPLYPSTSTSATKQFDFLIGHFLGVDHVGHRVGPSHPSMHAKLTQMDTALRKVVDLLDDETLLILLGDHGMDRAGDHGGDGVLETSSALWIYSKGPPLMDLSKSKPYSGLLEYKLFPGATTPWRAVQQIDLLPTLSLLLGLPIPHNNLGTVIPELFWRSSHSSPQTSGLELEKALTINSRQVRKFLNTYRSSYSGSELNSAWASLQSTWDAIAVAPQLMRQNAVEAKLVAMSSYNRSALSACRAIWAQFNPVLMAAGLALMVTAVLTTCIIYTILRSKNPVDAKALLRYMLPKVFPATVAATTAVLFILKFAGFAFPANFPSGLPLSALETGLFVGFMMGCVLLSVLALVEVNSVPTQWKTRLLGGEAAFGALLLVLHAASFFSNSFTFWEDKIILWLCTSSMVPFILWGIAAPGLSSTSSKTSKSSSSSTANKKTFADLWDRLGLTSLRGRILGFTFLFLVCIRLMSLVTVCREEQGAYCHVTFYATPPPPTYTPVDLDLNATAVGDSTFTPEAINTMTTSTTPPNWSLLLSLPAALAIPSVVTRILKITKSDSGVAPIIVRGIVTPALVGSWIFWILEWVEIEGFRTADSPLLKTFAMVIGFVEGFIRLRTLRSWIARSAFAWITLGTVGWWLLPLCLDIRVSTSSSSSVASSSSTPSPASQKKTQVTILGYANAYGASYLVFYLLLFSFIYMCTPLPGQVVLSLSSIALMSYLEALDGIRDVREIERVVGSALNPATISTSSAGTITATKPAQPGNDVTKQEHAQDEAEAEPTTLLTTIPLVLLTLITFYATGHQSTFSSMQWKTGFVMSERVKEPWTIITILLNTVGPFILLGIFGGGLGGGWKRSPTPSSPLTSRSAQTNGTEKEARPKTNEDVKLGENVKHSSFLTILLIQLYFLALLLGASTSAAVLRRHLMVWKVFAPRFMAAVIELIFIDLSVCLAVLFVNGRVVGQVGRTLGKVGIGRVFSRDGEKEE